MEGLDVIALQGGLTVSEEFYNGTYTYYNGTASQTALGNQISRPVYVAEYEERLNESKREIFILKKQYLESFVKDFKRQNSYKKSKEIKNVLKILLILNMRCITARHQRKNMILSSKVLKYSWKNGFRKKESTTTTWILKNGSFIMK